MSLQISHLDERLLPGIEFSLRAIAQVDYPIQMVDRVIEQ